MDINSESVPFQHIEYENDDEILKIIWKLIYSICFEYIKDHAELFNYNNRQSQYLSSCIIYCLWASKESKEGKELFGIKFKRMLNSFSYRKKQKEKNNIAFQCYINKDVRSKLTTIAKFEHRDANDVIVELICNRYKQVSPMLKK